MAVTRRQKEVLDFLTDFVKKNEYSPSYDEIARGLGLKSLATVHKHITNLANKGLLQRSHNRSRSIDVLPPRTKTRRSDRLPRPGASRLPGRLRRHRRPAARSRPVLGRRPERGGDGRPARGGRGRPGRDPRSARLPQPQGVRNRDAAKRLHRRLEAETKRGRF